MSSTRWEGSREESFWLIYLAQLLGIFCKSPYISWKNLCSRARAHVCLVKRRDLEISLPECIKMLRATEGRHFLPHAARKAHLHGLTLVVPGIIPAWTFLRLWGSVMAADIWAAGWLNPGFYRGIIAYQQHTYLTHITRTHVHLDAFARINMPALSVRIYKRHDVNRSVLWYITYPHFLFFIIKNENTSIRISFFI